MSTFNKISNLLGGPDTALGKAASTFGTMSATNQMMGGDGSLASTANTMGQVGGLLGAGNQAMGGQNGVLGALNAVGSLLGGNQQYPNMGVPSGQNQMGQMGNMMN